jgi:hypothetical protein
MRGPSSGMKLSVAKFVGQAPEYASPSTATLLQGRLVGRRFDSGYPIDRGFGGGLERCEEILDFAIDGKPAGARF